MITTYYTNEQFRKFSTEQKLYFGAGNVRRVKQGKRMVWAVTKVC